VPVSADSQYRKTSLLVAGVVPSVVTETLTWAAICAGEVTWPTGRTCPDGASRSSSPAPGTQRDGAHRILAGRACIAPHHDRSALAPWDGASSLLVRRARWAWVPCRIEIDWRASQLGDLLHPDQVGIRLWSHVSCSRPHTRRCPSKWRDVATDHQYVYRSRLVAGVVPVAVVTEILTRPAACAGDVTTIWVADLTV
jgi:hypothetical protein